MSKPRQEPAQIVDEDETGRAIASPAWTSAERARLRDLHAKGLADVEIAGELRRTAAAVRCQRYRLGLVVSRPTRRNPKLEAAVDALDEINAYARRRASQPLVDLIAEISRAALAKLRAD